MSSFARWLRGWYLAFTQHPSFVSDLLFCLHVFSPCCDRSDSDVLGPNNQYLPKIVSVFAEVSLLHCVVW